MMHLLKQIVDTLRTSVKPSRAPKTPALNFGGLETFAKMISRSPLVQETSKGTQMPKEPEPNVNGSMG